MESEEPWDFGNMGGAMPEETNGKPDSSISQNKAGIGGPDEGNTTGMEYASVTGSVSPSTNSGTGTPECIDVEDGENCHGSICSVKGSGAQEGPGAEVPHTYSSAGFIATTGRGASGCSANRHKGSEAGSIGEAIGSTALDQQ